MKLVSWIAFLALLTGCPQPSSSGDSSTSGGNEETGKTEEPQQEPEVVTTEEEPPKTGEEVAEEKKEEPKQEPKKKVEEKKETTTTVVQLGPALLELSVTQHDFGSQSLGSSTVYDVTVTNIGEKDARVLNYEGWIAPILFSLGTCQDSGTLKPQESCTFQVKYEPTAIADVTDALDITYFDTEASEDRKKVSVSLSGRTKPVLVSIDKAQGVDSMEVVLTGSNFTVNTAAKIGGSACTITAQTQTSITCNVPNKTLGAYAVEVSENGFTSELPGAFTYITNADLDLDITNHDFGQINYNNTVTVQITITNNGAYEASQIALTGLADQFSISNTTCGTELGGSQSCTVDVSYTPDALTNHSDTLLLDYNDGTSSASGSASISGEGIDRVIQISSGFQTTCALYHTGNVKCWGQGVYGMLGNGGTSNSSTPVDVSGITNAVQISVGFPAACAVLSDGTVKCWGQVYYPADTTNYTTPTALTGVTNAKQVSVGYYNNPSCIAHNDGTVKCWGDNAYGQIGDGTTTDRTTPVLVNDGAKQADEVFVGETFACGDDSGSLYCWGRNHRRTIDAAADVANLYTPTYVTSVTGYDAFQAGAIHWCGLKGTDLWCQGGDDYGQIGDNAVNNPGFEDLFMTLTGVSDLSTGLNTCAIVNGGVKCWGNNNFGQNGNSTLQNGQNTDTDVPGISTADKLAKYGYGAGSSCVILTDATVKCWGWNSRGQLGDGTTTNNHLPVTVQGLYP